MTEHVGGFILPPYLNPTALLGLDDDRTPEEREADRARWHAERLEAWRLYDAARPALAAIDDPLARAILDLHHADTIEWPTCQGCEFDGFEAEPPGWPCATVRIVAERFGIALPSDRYDLFRRPEENRVSDSLRPLRGTEWAAGPWRPAAASVNLGSSTVSRVVTDQPDPAVEPRPAGFTAPTPRRPDTAKRRYLLGYRFGWAELMNEARLRAENSGRRQVVRSEGPTWLIEDAADEGRP